MLDKPEFWKKILWQVLNQFQSDALKVAFFSIGIALYGIIIWHYYRFLATRDIIKSEEIKESGFWGFVKRATSGVFYFLTYIIFFPIISFIMFALLSIFLFFLAKEQSVQNILLISITLISATRITAYYNEDLARDIAKLIPFALLGVAIIQPNFFSINLVIQRINSLPSFLVNISSFILFTVILEATLKIFLTIKKIVLGSKQEKKEREEPKIGQPLQVKIGKQG